VASGGANGFENLLIVALLTVMTTFATAFSLKTSPARRLHVFGSYGLFSKA
jgi:hypothetical protein